MNLLLCFYNLSFYVCKELVHQCMWMHTIFRSLSMHFTNSWQYFSINHVCFPSLGTILSISLCIEFVICLLYYIHFVIWKFAGSSSYKISCQHFSHSIFICIWSSIDGTDSILYDQWSSRVESGAVWALGGHLCCKLLFNIYLPSVSCLLWMYNLFSVI